MTDKCATLQEAAVLVPIYRDAVGELRMVIIRRTNWGVHGGQLAFPGGKRVLADKSFMETALREANEEIGINPRNAEILDELPVVETVTTGYRIHPYLGRIVAPLKWRREEREVAEILEVNVADLADPSVHGEETRWYPVWPRPRRIPFYRVGAHKLWGATYRILNPLLPRLIAREWPL